VCHRNYCLSQLFTSQSLAANVFYVGFDLFENKDAFFKSHPHDLAQYDMDERPYWEFWSGQHAFDKVRNKISSVLPEGNFYLIEGDSTTTIPTHADKIRNASVIYIDGCHDYDIVAQDWANVVPIFQTNPDLIVVFDDLLYEGVLRLRTEIERLRGQLNLFILNDNQFFVMFKKSSWSGKWLLMGERVWWVERSRL